MEGLERILEKHRFFAGLEKGFRGLLTGCARNMRFEAGAYLFHEGEPADQFFLIRHGRVSLELAAPGRAAVTFQTIGEAGVVGVSWLVPPYRWSYDAKALDLTRAIALDADCLRRKCEEDHDLGYDLMKRFVPILVERLQATRLQALDIYGAGD